MRYRTDLAARGVAVLALCVTGAAMATAAASAPARAAARHSTAHAGLLASMRARAAQAPAPRSALVDPICQTALDPAARVVAVTAVMRPMTGTDKLALMFTMYEKPAGATGWMVITSPGAPLGSWITPPNATLGRRSGDVWDVPFEVANLAGPATYRFRVSFRWTGAHSRVLALVQRTSDSCRQTEMRPDLTVGNLGIAADPLHPRIDQFTATLDNLGLTGAGPFTVQLSYTHAGASVTKDQTILRIGPHGKRALTFAGTLCDAGTNVSLTADPLDQIDVYSRTQARITVPCPGPVTTTVTATAVPSLSLTDTSSAVSTSTVTWTEVSTATVTSSAVSSGTVTSTVVSSSPVTSSAVSSSTVTSTAVSSSPVTSSAVSSSTTSTVVSSSPVTTSAPPSSTAT